MPSPSHHLSLNQLKHLTAIGVALSAERDLSRLLSQILLSAKEITGADGGTFYRREGGQLRFEMVCNTTLGLGYGGSLGEAPPFPPVPLHLPDGSPNSAQLAAYVALEGRSVNIPDVYQTTEFDFTGPQAFDQKMSYRSTSILTVPLRDHEGEVLGVLQLLNAKDAAGRNIPFTPDDQVLVEALASQAAVAWSNRKLMGQMERLFESLAQVLGIALDEKSPYTGGHCERVPLITLMLADAACATAEGPLREFTLTEAERYELKISALLHDVGKVSTPVHVVDKATKLETIHDRIHEIEMRFDVLKAEAELEFLRSQLHGKDAASAQKVRDGVLAQLDEDLDFVRLCNKGAEFMAPERQERIRAMAGRILPDGRPLLTQDEVDNLCIPRGTITPDERDVINGHVTTTLRMLDALPWPKHLKRVPEIAGGHHERMDGKGYPQGLRGEELSVQARIMAIADVFEALTAKDRPYKDGKKLSDTLGILRKMGEQGHLDPDLLDVFFGEKLYLAYAREHMDPAQVDVS